MTAALTHAQYSRAHLLRLLDDLDGTVQPSESETIALVPREPLPSSGILAAHPQRAAIEEYAQRSETGAFIFVGPGISTIIAPPYPVTVSLRASGIQTGALRAAVGCSPRIAAVLLRFGGYALGVYDGERLLESHNGSRFVKNRHRKGGQSQRRFDRIREKQVHELFEHLCREAEQRLPLHAGRLDWLVFGGDIHTVQSFLKTCRYLREFPCPVLPRFLTVPEPRHETLERLPVLLSSSRVTIVEG